jgi:uncharacterized protein YciI
MQRVFLVVREPGSRWQAGLPAAQQDGHAMHAAFRDGLFRAGYLLFGGPLTEVPGKIVLVIAADDRDAVRALIDQDPWARNDVLRVASVHAWEWQLAAA